MQNKHDLSSNYPEQKYTIVGAGILGYISVYHLWQKSVQQGKQIRVTLQEKNHSLADTTTSNIFPSLTIDEIMSVVPPAPELLSKLRTSFNLPGGIRIEDVNGVMDSKVYHEFLHAVEKYGINVDEHLKRVEVLYSLGVMSMNAWQEMFDTADEELKDIMLKSNFQPCKESLKKDRPELHDGYRIDLIYNVASANPSVNNALNKANSMKSEYKRLGYNHCEILSPAEVLRRDPHLADFCNEHSVENDEGNRVWKNTASAIWRPGGCIDTNRFLPLLHGYLTEKMGTYTNANGKIKNCFRAHYERNVQSLTFDSSNQTERKITGMKFFNKGEVKSDNHAYAQSNYLFCPGENVGTLKSLGLAEPEYTRFAGASLTLVIDIPASMLESVKDYNHCMEVHQEGVVLAWQGRVIDGKLSIGVAGTKAFYADKEPQITEAFAKDRNLLQLNMINDVLPQFISLALGRDTKGQKLTAQDMQILVDAGIAKRWVGSRAVAFDGFPTIGKVAANGQTITHAGSGGVSFAHALVKTLFKCVKTNEEKLAKDTLLYADPNRTFRN
ncbi:MAG: hypothetical protein WC627_02590 [Legionella sp.]|jgi:hypothetical protein